MRPLGDWAVDASLPLSADVEETVLDWSKRQLACVACAEPEWMALPASDYKVGAQEVPAPGVGLDGLVEDGIDRPEQCLDMRLAIQ